MSSPPKQAQQIARLLKIGLLICSVLIFGNAALRFIDGDSLMGGIWAFFGLVLAGMYPFTSKVAEYWDDDYRQKKAAEKIAEEARRNAEQWEADRLAEEAARRTPEEVEASRQQLLPKRQQPLNEILQQRRTTKTNA